MSDKRFTSESGNEAFTGNELLLKGGLESRMALLTGYPGSPVSDIFDAIYANRDLLKKHGILGQMANNEALAAARLNGARMASLRAVAVMKSVGMHVASDGLAIGNLTEPNRPEGGCLVVVGDDSWNETTQINSDSRFLALHLHMPILEPSTFQEIKDWMDVGFELSGHSNLYVAYVITTNQADGGGTVAVKKNSYPAINMHQKTALSSSDLPVKDYVMIPPHTSQKEATLESRYEKFLSLASIKNLNKILYKKSSKGQRETLGFVCSGFSYCYLEHALLEMGLSGKFPILKLGVTHPLDREIVKKFVRELEHAVVIEEKRPFLESQIRGVIQEFNQRSGGNEVLNVQVHGKKFPFDLPGIPEVKGLNPSILIDRLAPLIIKMNIPELKLNKEKIEQELSLMRGTAAYEVKVPLRTPTFCPGCPHRDSAAVSLKIKEDFSNPEIMKKRFKKEPTDVIFHGESGCHSMLQFAPNEGLMQNYSGMGLGGGTGAGIDPFIRNKQVVFLGDSTFFHSGMIAVSDSLKNNQDITYIILDNKTTAMTGHQPTPGNDFDILGRETFAQNLEDVIKGMAGGKSIPIVRANPEYRDSYTRLLEEMVLKKGVKIVIADKECGITFQRRLRKDKKKVLREKGYLKKEESINITADVCENCLECVRSTGCPGLSVEETEFGPKIGTDLSNCVSDGACTKGKVCPSFEKIIITRKRPPKENNVWAVSGEIPIPKPGVFQDIYYVSTFAVGGMGAGVVSAILVRAGIEEGYEVSFLDKKGLAIRNGGVYGHILFNKNKGQVLSPLVPYGKADLILGIDILEAARGLDPKMNLRISNPDKTRAVVNTHKTQTVLSLMGRDHFDPKELEKTIQKYTRTQDYFGINFSEISQRYFSSKIYVNLLLIGAAFQKGLLPVSLKNLEKAVEDSVPAQDIKENIAALHLGRRVVLQPQKFLSEIQIKAQSYHDVLQEKSQMLSKKSFVGKKWSKRYKNMVSEAVRWMQLDDRTNKQIAFRAYELIQYENCELAEQYLALIWDIYRKDRKEMHFAATKAVIVNLFKVTAIKDEVYVAHLLTSEEKLKKDRLKYSIDESNGDRVDYIHLNRPQFTVLGLNIEFDMNTRNWMLRILKHLKFLRKILSAWHIREKDFRDWYISLVKKFNYYESQTVYRAAVEVLKCPETVRGYRQIRYPLMDAARVKVDGILARIQSGGLTDHDAKNFLKSSESII